MNLRVQSLFTNKLNKKREGKMRGKQRWNNLDVQRSFLEKFANENGIKTTNDWNKITTKQILEFGGRGLLQKYNRSLQTALETIFPHEEWNKMNRENVTRNFWKNRENQRKLVLDIADKLNIQKKEEWMNVSKFMFVNAAPKAASVLRLYNNSLFSLLLSLFPSSPPLSSSSSYNNIINSNDNDNTNANVNNNSDHDNNKDNNDQNIKEKREEGGGWMDVYKSRTKKLKKVWQNDEEIKKFLKKIIANFAIEKQKDFYRISNIQLVDLGASSLLRMTSPKPFLPSSSNKKKKTNQETKGFAYLLSKFYPNIGWDFNLFQKRAKKAEQRWIWICLRHLYPGEIVYEDYLHPKICFSESGVSIELDLFIPSFNLAMEYQGQHHFDEIPNAFAPSDSYKTRDHHKRELCKQNSIPLLIIPYWWDKSIGSLHSSLLSFHSSPSLTPSFIG